jgi:hypothetical protein
VPLGDRVEGAEELVELFDEALGLDAFGEAREAFEIGEHDGY